VSKIPFFQVDAFTDIPFKGNPAAVCLLESAIPDELMQQVAAENNLAETAFVLRVDNGFSLRWFTPTVEIQLCGHGTLASAHVLWQQGILASDERAEFLTLSGLLTVTKSESWIQLNFPKYSFSPIVVDREMTKALGVSPVRAVCADDGRYLIELGDTTELVAASPDFAMLKNFPSVAITCKAEQDSPYDFISRSFAPSHGVNEDPVTGSSHCALAPYWSVTLNKTEMVAFQASQRGGTLKLKIAGDRVLIEGKAITVIEGMLNV